MRNSHKICTSCDLPLKITKFEWANPSKKTRRNVCSKCRKLKQLYGITGPQFYRMLEDQMYSCLICEKKITERTAKTDHCHLSGKVRGLLCNHCNTGIGLLKHDPEIIERAGEFLRFNL